MLQYVPWEALNQKHLVWLANSMLAAPESARLDINPLMNRLRDGIYRLFEFSGGCLLVGVRGSRLTLQAFCTDPGINMDLCRVLAADLKRLAADWQCDAIETICFDPRFASVIKHLGGRVESQTLVMEVPDGRQ